VKTIAIMRPESTLAESARKVEELGFSVVAAPMLELRPLRDSRLEAFFAALSSGEADYVIFTSSNGVEFVLDLADEIGRKSLLLEGLAATNVVAIGPATARSLGSHGIKVSHVPDDYSSKGLLRLFSGLSLAGARIFLLRSARGSEELGPGLEALGASVVDVHLYTATAPHDLGPATELVRRAARGGIDIYCFTSTMTVENFFSLARQLGLLREVTERLREAKVAAIGEPTLNALRAHGIEAGIVPREQTFEALLDEVVARA
jgi:uroporphyrinogen-III synthase